MSKAALSFRCGEAFALTDFGPLLIIREAEPREIEEKGLPVSQRLTALAAAKPHQGSEPH